MWAMIDLELKNKITAIFMGESKVTNFFMFEQIPPDKLQNARSSYAPTIAADEVIIFLFDDTVFGSANEGFLLTTKNLYRKNLAEAMGSLRVEQIDRITVKHGFLSTTITASAGMHELNMTVTQANGRREKEALFQVLNKTVDLLKGTRDISWASESQTARPRNCPNCGAVCTGHARQCEYCDSIL